LAGAAGIETGAAVIEIGAAVIGNCGQLPAGFLATTAAERYFDQLTTDRRNYPRGRTSLVSSVAYDAWRHKNPRTLAPTSGIDHTASASLCGGWR
jgi:hypothetical protein